MEISEKEYAALLSRIEAVEQEAARAKAVNDIQNVASKFFWYHAHFRDDLIISEGLWAKKAEGIHAEFGISGVYEGYDSVIKFHEGRPNPPGKILYHAIDTPVIEIAGDGKTAKGVWLLHGCEGGSIPNEVATKVAPERFYIQHREDDGTKVWAQWTWAKYAMDFIKEDGVWKIWHFHGYDLMRTPFDMDFITSAKQNFQETQENQEGRPAKFGDDQGNVVFMDPADKPTTFNWVFDGDKERYFLFPEPPKPYKTFDDTFSY